ncbi:MAG: T9SS type A sorting domain-containing protein [Bacteroidota bacterium]
MKITITLLCSFFIFNIANAQSYGTLISENWKDGSWNTYRKDNVVYDANGDGINYLAKYYNTVNGSWQNFSQFDCSFRTDRKMDISTGQLWDTTTNSWNRIDSNYWLYNNAGKVLGWTRRYNTNGIWENNIRVNYEYDSSGYLVKLSSDVWKDSSSEWQNDWYKLYSNNSNGTVRQYVEQNWNRPGNTLDNGDRYTFTYEPGSARPATEIRELFNNKDSSWTAYLHISYTYTDTLDSALGQGNEAAGWVNSTLIINKYDNEKRKIRYEIFRWNRDRNSWDNNVRQIYTYDLTSGISETNKTFFGLYPNPASNALTLKLDQPGTSVIKITDMQGRLMMVKQDAGQELNINLSDLLPSVYFISVEQGGAIQVSKFVKL